MDMHGSLINFAFPLFLLLIPCLLVFAIFILRKHENARDGISNTFSTTTKTLGGTPEEQTTNLSTLLDSYFKKNSHHLNVNIMNKETLINAMEHPELYPQLTIRVSGYAVNFIKLNREQQQEVLSRTFFETM